MRTVGVDLSASERQTALAAIEWEGNRARVGEPSPGHADAALLDCLAAAEWVGIDAPFGWPQPMVADPYLCDLGPLAAGRQAGLPLPAHRPLRP